MSNADELNHPTLENLIQKSKTILEIGAGEGRIIQGLVNQNYQGKIFAVERSRAFLDHLRKEYSKNNNVEILEGDILYKILPRVDLGLFLWSGILEFNKRDQKTGISQKDNLIRKIIRK